jgi:hypothetical protein
MYVQLFFILERLKSMAPEHPEWEKQQPHKAALENDLKTLMQQGEQGLLTILMETHAGNTSKEFENHVKDWIATARHPTKNELFTSLVYQPMLELVDYLKANDFKVFIVSGGGIEFVRAWSEEVYGIPKDQIVGSSIKLKFDYNDGNPVVRRLAEMDFIDDKEGKPVGIQRYIGRKPVIAAGNSDGDLQMLQWAASNPYKSLKLLVHHTDSIREWAYDRRSQIGRLDKGLDEALKNDWTIIDMGNDWNVIYPFEMQ